MLGACRMVESSKTYCMASWLLDPDLLEGLFSGTKMSVNEIWKTANVNPADWEATAAYRSSWRLAVKAGMQTSELKREEQCQEEKRQCRRQKAASASTEPGAVYTCSNCNKACRSRIGLYSHSRRCNSSTDWSMVHIPLSPETNGCQQQKEYTRVDTNWHNCTSGSEHHFI